MLTLNTLIRLAFAMAGVALIVLLVVVVSGGGSSRAASIAQPPTQQPATGIPAATNVPTESPRTIRTAVPLPTEIIASPTAIFIPTAAPPTARPTPPAQVTSIAPQPAYGGALPIILTIHGANLDLVRAARLVADSRLPIDTTMQSSGADQLTLSVAALPEQLNGEAIYRLELDGIVLETPEIALRDFLDRKTMQGVLPEYDYTNRVASNAAGVYTRMRSEPDVNSPPVGFLWSDDEVDILSADHDGWYQVRIHSGSDASQIGMIGWVERWLVDNQDVPTPARPTPKPQPLAFVGRVYSAPIDKAAQCGASFESSIYGSVENRSGRGIAGARLRVASADGKNVYSTTTGRGGIYSVSGLGCTTWTIRLISIPGAAIQANAVTVKNLNGGRFTSAEVRFKLQNSN